MSQHHIQDLLMWIPFAVGVCLYVLILAGKAIRNPKANIHMRRDYLYANWDIILVRSLPELLVYWAWRHIPLAYWLSFSGIKQVEWFQMFWESAVCGALVGMLADWIITQIATLGIIPAGIRKFFAENLPQLPINPEGGSGT